MVSRRRFIRDSLIALGGAHIFGPQLLSEGGYHVVANIPSCEMRLYQNGKEVNRYDISVGRPGKHTKSSQKRTGKTSLQGHG